LKLAYFIMCHKNSSQVARLIKAIYQKDNIYLLHTDLKSGENYLDELKSLCQSYDNVYFMDPIVVSWGGWSLVEVQNRAIKKLLELDQEWKYFINLSGQCYPLKSQNEIKAFLKESNSSHIYFNNLLDPFYFQFFVERQETIIKELNGVAIDTGVKRLYFSQEFGDDLFLGMGSQWVMLERDFCEYLCAENPLIERFITYFKTFNIPDEHFIQTIIVNSPFIERVVNNIYRHIYIPTNESHPKIFTADDYKDLIATDCFFARKFDEHTDSTIMDLLDEHL
jgi:hypothetical protein